MQFGKADLEEDDDTYAPYKDQSSKAKTECKPNVKSSTTQKKPSRCDIDAPYIQQTSYFSSCEVTSSTSENKNDGEIPEVQTLQADKQTENLVSQTIANLPKQQKSTKSSKMVPTTTIVSGPLSNGSEISVRDPHPSPTASKLNPMSQTVDTKVQQTSQITNSKTSGTSTILTDVEAKNRDVNVSKQNSEPVKSQMEPDKSVRQPLQIIDPSRNPAMPIVPPLLQQQFPFNRNMPVPINPTYMALQRQQMAPGYMAQPSINPGMTNCLLPQYNNSHFFYTQPLPQQAPQCCPQIQPHQLYQLPTNPMSASGGPNGGISSIQPSYTQRLQLVETMFKFIVVIMSSPALPTPQSVEALKHSLDGFLPTSQPDNQRPPDSDLS